MRKFFKTGLFLLILGLPLGSQGPALAYEPPMGDLQAWVDGYFVYFTVTDPVRGLRQGSVLQYPLPGGSIIIQGLLIQDGVVAWIHGAKSWFDLVYSYYVHYVTYDPGTGTWQKGVWGPYSAVANLTAKGGVAAWAHRLSNPDRIGVDFVIYDPADGALRQSGWVTPGAGPLPFISLNYSSVFWDTYAYGYTYSTKSWISGSFSRTMSYFVAQPASGPPPFTVWFTDMSIGGETWSWDFGDGAISSSRSISHVYTRAGTYKVKLTLTSPAGGGAYSERTVVVGGSPAPMLPLLLD
jgi:hypothetical protein